MIYYLHRWDVRKTYNLAYKKGGNDAAAKVVEFSYWMIKHPMIHNALYIVGYQLSKYTCLNSYKIREDINTIGNVRLGDLEPDIRKEFLK